MHKRPQNDAYFGLTWANGCRLTHTLELHAQTAAAGHIVENAQLAGEWSQVMFCARASENTNVLEPCPQTAAEWCKFFATLPEGSARNPGSPHPAKATDTIQSYKNPFRQAQLGNEERERERERALHVYCITFSFFTTRKSALYTPTQPPCRCNIGHMADNDMINGLYQHSDWHLWQKYTQTRIFLFLYMYITCMWNHASHVFCLVSLWIWISYILMHPDAQWYYVVMHVYIVVYLRQWKQCLGRTSEIMNKVWCIIAK